MTAHEVRFVDFILRGFDNLPPLLPRKGDDASIAEVGVPWDRVHLYETEFSAYKRSVCFHYLADLGHSLIFVQVESLDYFDLLCSSISMSFTYLYYSDSIAFVNMG